MRKTDVWKIGKKAIAAIAVFAMVFSVFVGMNAQNVSAEVFGTDVEVSASGYYPDVAVDSAGNIYVVFNGEIGTSGGDGILLKKSTDNGASFPSSVAISPGANGDGGTKPSIAIDASGNISVAYIYPDYHIYYANSINGGVSFTTPIQISDAAASSLYGPDIAVDSAGVIYVVWAGDDCNIYIDKSTDGAAFGTDIQVNPTAAGVRASPSIAIDGSDNILVAWCGSSGDHVSFAKSTTSWDTFSAPVQVDDSDSGATYPSIGVGADGNIFVAWVYSIGGYPDIYVSASSDDGASFNAGVLVNTDATDTDQKFPSLAVHPCGKVFVAWQDERSGTNNEIYFANSTDGGATFGINTKVSDGMPATYNSNPSLTVGSDTEVYVVGRGSTTSSGKIYFSQAPDATWPNAVEDLAAVNATTSSLNLTWTAPGDNFALDNFVLGGEYDIRYSTSEITEANWDTATPCTDEPTPSVADTAETFQVTGLTNDTTYYFALKTADEIPNWSPTISTASGKTLDDWAPNAVTLVASDPTSNSIKLTWTAPGDNGNIGTADTYDIRYNTTEVNDTTWADAIQCPLGEFVPSEAGTTETFVVTGLSSGTKYYFVLKTADEVPNWSDLSNVVNESTTTNTPPVASNLAITPTVPKTTDDLVRSYIYSDVETDAESGTEIRWYKDDVLQTAYNDALTIPSTGTAKGQVWYFTVKPNDGIEFGVLVTSPSVTILNSAPVANFTLSPAGLYYRGAVITFNASVSTDSDTGDIVNYTWNVSGEIKYGLEVDYTFTTLGTFDVILTVKDASDVVNITTLQVTIVNQAPTASFTVSATEVKVGVEIEFTSTSTDPESDTLTYIWDFGDGTNSTEANPKHTYDSAGTYEVTLKVTDAYDAEHTSTATTITIKAATITEPTTGAIITAQYTGTGNVSAASASSPGAAPSGKEGIGKFVEITKSATLNINWVYITVPYTESDLPSGVDESSLKMYYWTGTEWAVCDNTGVDTANKVVYANVTHLTIFAPMAESAAVTPTTPVNWALYGGVVAVIAIVIIAAAAVVITKKKKGKGETPAETEE